METSTDQRWLINELWLLAAVPFALVTWQAVQAPRLHVLLDYWHVLAKVTADDGSLIPGALFSYHLEQPFALPSLLFWGDAGLAGGDNRALTLLTVALLAAVVLLLRSLLPESLGAVRRTALTAGFAFLLLSAHGIELWLQGTNGASWAPALFFLVLAVVCAHRGRFWPALAAAAIGSLSFGVAFPAWFAIGLVAWLRRDAWWRVAAPVALGAAVLAFWLLTRPAGAQAAATSGFEPGHRLAVFGASLGSMWSPGVAWVAIAAGVLVLGVLAYCGRAAVRARAADQAGWLGLGLCAVALALLLALGRTTGSGTNVGLLSRYSLVGGLAACAALALAALRWNPRPGWLVAAVAAVGLVTEITGYTQVNQVRASYESLGTVAYALRVNDPAALAELRINPAVVPAARSLGAYPFTGDFTLGCGGRELGDRVPPESPRPLPGPSGPLSTKGVVDTRAPLLTGWAVVDGKRADCVLVTDDAGTVTGGGLTGVGRSDAGGLTGEPNAGWQAAAAPDSRGRIVVVSAGGVLYRIDENAHGERG
ncbi:DUF2079 domain-containing protein [Amycolatopsis anabasis]|uniref:DUF2079 domain-containing protein n=1 Tax=Amycolatopsis anabasis TaxID=1840409 RepID=UPI001FE7E42A|nr:DUF2079 domain-containing protein [Amycolatopsis anabasis]